MAEAFSNNAQSTLDGAINNSVTNFDVIDGSTFPSTGQFRIIVDDEIMLVTGRMSDNFSITTRGAEGTTAASHSNGATVSHVLTAGAIEEIRASEANVEAIVEDFLIPGHGISLTPGGGVLTVEAFFIHSIVQSAGALALDGDTGTPGNNYFYGTNGSGVKGWYAISGGSSDFDTEYEVISNNIVRLDTDAPVTISVNGDSPLLVADESAADARGEKAVDLQIVRSNSAMVAKGLKSAIIGGEDNKIGADAENAGVFGGIDNECNSVHSVILGGASNLSTYSEFVSCNGMLGGSSNTFTQASHCVILGGGSNSIVIGGAYSPYYCGILGGQSNYIQSNGSQSNNCSAIIGSSFCYITNTNNVIINGTYCNAYTPSSHCVIMGVSGIVGVNSQDDYNVFVHSHPSGVSGDNQYMRYLSSAVTSNGTPVTMYVDGNGATKFITIGPNYHATIEIHVIAAANDGSGASFIVYANVSNTGFGVIVNNSYSDLSYTTMGYIYSIALQTSGDYIWLQVTGQDGYEVKWFATWNVTRVYQSISGGSSS